MLKGTLFAVVAALIGTSAWSSEMSHEAPKLEVPLIIANMQLDVDHQIQPDGIMRVVLNAAQEANTSPAPILKMAMSDGDAFSFSLPGHPDILLRFQRVDETLSVTREEIAFMNIAQAD